VGEEEGEGWVEAELGEAEGCEDEEGEGSN